MNPIELIFSLRAENDTIHAKKATIQPTINSAGEVDLSKLLIIQDNVTVVRVLVAVELNSSDDIIALLLVNNLLERRIPHISRALSMPYVPYARYGDIPTSEKPFSLKVFANAINSCGFDDVYIADPPSPVSSALIDNVTVLDVKKILSRIKNDPSTNWDDVVLVCPNAEKTERTYQIAQACGFKDVIRTGKEREVETGFIVKNEIYGEVTDKRCLIVSDMCVTGHQFLTLADELRKVGAKEVILYVTHGIFSKGLGSFDGLIDSVYTTDSINQNERIQEADSLSLEFNVIDIK